MPDGRRDVDVYGCMLNTEDEMRVLVCVFDVLVWSTVEYKVVVAPLMIVMLMFTMRTSMMMLFTYTETWASHEGTPVG